MKKAAFILFTVFFIFSCDSGTMNKLTITYNGNGHTSGDVPIDTNKYTEGAEAVISDANNLEKTGFSFAGWQHGEKVFKPGDSITVKGNIELTAMWNEKKYRVIYDGNGYTEGTLPVDDNLYAEGDFFRLSQPDLLSIYLIREGRLAIGWDIEGAISVIPWNIDYGNGKYGTTSFSTITFSNTDIIITALWEIPWHLLPDK